MAPPRFWDRARCGIKTAADTSIAVMAFLADSARRTTPAAVRLLVDPRITLRPPLSGSRPPVRPRESSAAKNSRPRKPLPAGRIADRNFFPAMCALRSRKRPRNLDRFRIDVLVVIEPVRGAISFAASSPMNAAWNACSPSDEKQPESPHMVRCVPPALPIHLADLHPESQPSSAAFHPPR